MKPGRLFLWAFLTLALMLPTLAEPRAETAAAATISADPSAVIRNFYAQLTDVMKQGDKLGFAGRCKKLEPAIRASFNLPLMTRIAVGTVWMNATAEEQQQLVAAFSSFSVANYASQFKAYDGEQFILVDTKPAPGGVIVDTKLQPKTGDGVALNYLMRQDEHGAWRVVDVFLDGAISELAARRSEFSSIAKRDGIPALVNSLDEKSRQMGPS